MFPAVARCLHFCPVFLLFFRFIAKPYSYLVIDPIVTIFILAYAQNAEATGISFHYQISTDKIKKKFSSNFHQHWLWKKKLKIYGKKKLLLLKIL